MSTSPIELPTDSVTSLLIAQRVVLVHFFGEGPGVRGESCVSLSPIQEMIRVCEGREVPCSTVAVGDCRAQNNYFGRIGLILDPGQRLNVTHSSPIDGGTESPDVDGEPRKRTNQRRDNASIVGAIQNRPSTEHNEIDVKGYRVVGLFYEPLNQDDVTRPQPITFCRESGCSIYPYTYFDFGSSSPDLPCFLWTKSLFFKVSWNSAMRTYDFSKAQQVRIEDVYSS